ncbi:MAG TPA: CDP-alcohol phosphatidyltransferase family protein [Acidimicrobiales bacterium]|nr:CDP-alcohol phosphatidyltransferase family protein [Acidimicrobiales bacterium]
MIDGRRGRRSANGASDEGSGEPRKSILARIALGSRLHRLGVTANQITVLGLLLAGVTAVVVGRGYLLAGVVLITVGGLMDSLDGAVAKAAGSTSNRGAFLDSTADRVADGLIFGGVAYYFIAGHHPKLALLPFAILAASAVVSYERAKAESLGFVAKGGLMERAERLILLGIGLAFHFALIFVLWTLLVLTAVTAVQRFVKVWRQATAELTGASQAEEPVPATLATAGPRFRAGRVESRWRAWREASLRDGTAAARRARTPASRWRARRQAEPLASRVRRALEADRAGQPHARTARSARPPRQARTSGGARSSIRGLGRRFDQSR